MCPFCKATISCVSINRNLTCSLNNAYSCKCDTWGQHDLYAALLEADPGDWQGPAAEYLAI